MDKTKSIALVPKLLYGLGISAAVAVGLTLLIIAIAWFGVTQLS